MSVLYIRLDLHCCNVCEDLRVYNAERNYVTRCCKYKIQSYQLIMCVELVYELKKFLDFSLRIEYNIVEQRFCLI